MYLINAMMMSVLGNSYHSKNYMKKLFSVLLVTALLLAVLAGCQSTADHATPKANVQQTIPGPQESMPPTEQVPFPAETTAPTVNYITQEKAKTIALQDAGLTESDVRDLEVELDKDDGVLHYNVDFEKDGYDYEYEIDAKSGKILKSQKERD